MTYQQYLKLAPEMTEKISVALVNTVHEIGLAEAKKLDWMTTSADANIAAASVQAA